MADENPVFEGLDSTGHKQTPSNEYKTEGQAAGVRKSRPAVERRGNFAVTTTTVHRHIVEESESTEDSTAPAVEDYDENKMPSPAEIEDSRRVMERLIRLGLAGPEDLYGTEYESPYQPTTMLARESDTEKLIPVNIPEELLSVNGQPKKGESAEEQNKKVRISCDDTSDDNGSDAEEDPELGLGKKPSKKTAPLKEPLIFWDQVSALRRTKYGIAAWVIGWNLLAFLTSRREMSKAWPFVPVCALGFTLIASGWHAHKVSKRRRFRGLVTMVPIVAAQTAFSVAVFRCQGHMAFGNVNIGFDDVFKHGLYQTVASYLHQMKPPMFFALGNLILMLFIVRTGFLTVRMVILRFGEFVDEVAEKLGLAAEAVKDEDEEKGHRVGDFVKAGRNEDWIVEQLRKTGFM